MEQIFADPEILMVRTFPKYVKLFFYAKKFSSTQIQKIKMSFFGH